MIHILIPTFNRESMILNAIDSITVQSYKKWKITIVDNYSSDNTVQIITKKYRNLINKKIFIKKFKTFVSAAENFNRSLKQITSEKYFMLLCSDDYIHKNFLEIGLRKLNEEKKSCGYCSAIYYVDQNKKIIKKRNYGFYGFEVMASFFFRNYIGVPSSSIFKTKDYKNFKYPISIPYAADMVFPLWPYKKKKRIIYDSNPLSYFMIHSKTDSSNNFGSWTMLVGKYKFRIHIVKKIFNCSKFFQKTLLVIAKNMLFVELYFFKFYSFLKCLKK
tara:strand:+ start:2237 stop:3058 length:822 start_codon:yes stop_codon:yes gene_type:complete